MIEHLRLGETAAMASVAEARDWIGLRVDDVFGITVGSVVDVVAGAAGEARWLLIGLGRFDAGHTLVPFADASAGDENVWVPYERATMRKAPRVEPGAGISAQFDRRLADHYEAARGWPVAPPLPSPRPAAEHAHRLGAMRRRGG